MAALLAAARLAEVPAGLAPAPVAPLAGFSNGVYVASRKMVPLCVEVVFEEVLKEGRRRGACSACGACCYVCVNA